MKYIVNAFWKHENPINVEIGIDTMMALRDVFEDEEHVLETIWYQIDEYKHGSVVIYKSEESYLAHLDKNTMQRAITAKEGGITMIEEYKGPAFAIQTELPEDRTA